MMYTILVFLVLTASCAHADWVPPTQPDPSKILQEAHADAIAGHYEDALAKHVWYHENALRYQAAQYGVRLSFALSYWEELGKKYPPALGKLKEIRDKDGDIVREAVHAEDAYQSFVEYAAISKTLHEQDKTTELFRLLDSTKPPVPQSIFDYAEPSLVDSKEYKLCGKYLDPAESLARLVQMHQQQIRLSGNPRFGKKFEAFTEKSFTYGATTLIALLVINDRKAEADHIASEARQEVNTADFEHELAEAQKGVVPAPWP